MKISIAICTYNGEKYIKEQLDSILNQTLLPNEIIIGDDQSTDNTISIIKECLDNKKINYRIIINDTRLGVTKNFENVIKECSGDIVFTCDQDDVWKKNKVERILSEFDSIDTVLVFSNADIVDKELNYIETSLWQTLNFSYKQLINEGYLKILLNRRFVTGATIAFRKDFFDKVIPIPEIWLHDGWLSITAPFYGNVVAIDECLILYRQHGNNVVGAHKKSFSSLIDSYFKNFRNLETKYKDRYIRYKMFVDRFSNLSNENYNKIFSCFKFWETLYISFHKNKLERISLICKEYLKGNYKRYYTGFEGFLRDFVLVFFGDKK